MNRVSREILNELVLHLSAKKTQDKVTKYIDTRIKASQIKDDENGDLTSLDLSGLNAHFKGGRYQPEVVLSECIGNLKHLTFLSLHDCIIHGNMPRALGELLLLEKLDISKNMLTDEIPDEIGRCVCLTQLNLMDNQFTCVPSNIGNLEKLLHLNLSTNRIRTLPDEIRSCMNLQALYVANNQLTHLPDGVSILVNLNHLDISNNHFTSTIPLCIERLTNLHSLLLGNNDFEGTLPAQSLTRCMQLRHFDVSGNSRLYGFLPVLPVNCDINAKNTGLSLVTVRTYKLKKDFCYIDYISVISFVTIGYADLITDALSIAVLFSIGQSESAWLNLSFIFLETVIAIYVSEKTLIQMFLTITQLGIFVEGYMSIMQGVQTQGFVASKKLDAVSRSMPSMVLQLYTLLDTLDEITDDTLYLLAISVVLSALGSAATLSQLHPKSTSNIFALSYVAINLYYICEVVVRISSLAMMFVSLKYYASIPVGLEFLFRMYKSSSQVQGLLDIDYSMTMLWMGSDDAMHQHDLWLVGSLVTFFEVFVFTFVVNFASTHELDVMRDRDVTKIITSLTWVALGLKILLHYFIGTLPHPANYYQDDENDVDNVDVEADMVISKLHKTVPR